MRVSRNGFAAACGVSGQAIHKALVGGWLTLEPDGKTIDPERPSNARYLSDRVAGLDVLWRETGRPGLPKSPIAPSPSTAAPSAAPRTAETLRTARAGRRDICRGACAERVFKTDRSAAVHARLFSRRLAIRATN